MSVCLKAYAKVGGIEKIARSCAPICPEVQTSSYFGISASTSCCYTDGCNNSFVVKSNSIILTISFLLAFLFF